MLLGLAGRRVALNPRRSPFDLIDLGLNLAVAFQLVAWGALAVYLLWRSGIRARADRARQGALAARCAGRTRPRGADRAPRTGLVRGRQGAGVERARGARELYDTWWRIPVLLITAFANGWAEEIIVVAFLLTRLRQLRVNPVAAMLASSLLRGAYHLYQGFSAGLGNVVMGLVFAYVWRRTGRLWPLIIAHGIIDSVAYVGYAFAAGHLGWLS